ncbi:MAG TPA: CYTH and CHAD domain-containing protein [Micromonosporaceae bacterium]|nr:CYTH and CHAD domain-containing protein [Micromonosporaceae bacterium]
MPVEEERKYGVGTRFVLPHLTGTLPDGGTVTTHPPVTLTATYYDTADLRLARAGVSLRYRAGDSDRPWTVKLPTDTPGSRHEIDVSGHPDAIPAPLVDLTTVYHRGQPLAPVVTIRTSRVRHDLRDTDGTLLAEVADDGVSVLDGRRVRTRFREVEVERKAAPRKLLRRIGAALHDAGAVEGVFAAKHARALGEPAAQPPDLTPPTRRPSRSDSAADVITYALAIDVIRTLSHDPLVRLRAGVGNNDTAVHQMRVGLRRLRTDLRVFGTLLDQEWVQSVDGELRWIAGMLGAARDAEVQRERLRHTAALDPAYPLDEEMIAGIDAELALWQHQALDALDDALATPRYVALAGTLVTAASQPPTSGLAAGPADTVLPGLVSREWRKFARRADALLGTPPTPAGHPDQEWHDVRKLAKRARYASEVTALVVGAPAADLAQALAAVGELLGTHQDACVAAQTWLQINQSAPDDRRLAVTTARLFERERDTARGAQAAYPALWREISGERLTGWLR